jgi:hypothetical protein
MTGREALAEAAAAETARVYGAVSREWHGETEDTPTTHLMRHEHGRRLWALAAVVGQDSIPGIDDERAVA